MANEDFLGQGWRFPFEFGAGGLKSSSGADSIRESILTLLRTSPGERVMRPTFGCGVNELLFSENNRTTATQVALKVEIALKRFEPRITVDRVAVEPDADEESRMNINIDYTIRAANRRENLVYPFYLQNG
jgi:hypothetical protein